MSDNEESYFDLVRKKNKSSGGFQSFSFSRPLFNAITRKGYKNPTPIQRKTIPLILDGKDVIGMSRTGSGKTLAFLAPLIEKLSHDIGKSGVKAVILSPTRELAIQTFKVFKDLNRGTKLKCACILGGDALDKHFAAMHDNPDLLIATPGRLLHVLVEMDRKLPEVNYLVMDECDRLFEMGFGEQLTEILHRLPEHRQTLLFSATLPQTVVDFVKAGLHDPVLVRLDVESKLSENLTSCFIQCREADKISILLYLLRFVIGKGEMTVIFTATRHHVEYLHDILEKASIECTQVYSALDQEARKTNTNLFRSGKVKTMIVTDIAARGIDIPFLDNVINFNFPAKPKLYVHRVGRVARAGRSGKAYSLVSIDELPFLEELHLFLDKPMKVAHNDSTVEDSLIGKAPQSLIDNENDTLSKWHESYVELRGIRKVCENATKQYIKTRSLPSSEAVKKAKELSQQPMAIHPIFKNASIKPEEEESKADFLSSLKNYKPRTTIFEIGPNKKEYLDVMKIKRQHHDKVVAKAHKRSTHQDDEIEKDFKDENFFLPYQSKDHYSEKGLDVEKSFTKDLNDAVFDIGGDDSKTLNKPKSSLKWDRKKKKFVGENSDDAKKKKIKTESGAWISASYKSNLYKKWQEKSKTAGHDDDDEDENEDGDAVHHEVEKRDRAISKAQKRSKKKKGSAGKTVKSELKGKADLLKARLAKEKKRKFMEWRRKEKAAKKGKSR